MSQIYNCIDITAIHDIEDKSLIAFGAGKGTEQFIDFLAENHISSSILAITDNNPSLHGKSLLGIDIIPPASLKQIAFDKIVVT